MPGKRAGRQQLIVHDDEYVPDEQQGEVGFEGNLVAGCPAVPLRRFFAAMRALPAGQRSPRSPSTTRTACPAPGSPLEPATIVPAVRSNLFRERRAQAATLSSWR